MASRRCFLAGCTVHPMSKAIDDLLDILDLEKIEDNLFRGLSPQVGWQRVFGGLVIAQALVAAQRTVENATAHSLHAYFLLGGDPSDADRLPGRAPARRAQLCDPALSGDPARRVIFSLVASFHNPEPQNLDHAFPPPDAPSPEDIARRKRIFRAFRGSHARAGAPLFSARAANRDASGRTRPLYRPRRPCPIRCKRSGSAPRAPLPDDPAIHRAALAYLSDMTLLDTSLIVHGKSVFHPDIQAASLDHALWLHRPFRADEWMLYVQDSPNASGGLGFQPRRALFARRRPDRLGRAGRPDPLET